MKEKQRIARVEAQVLTMAVDERKILTRLGTRKLHHQISLSLSEAGIRFGRDKLFRLLKDHELLDPSPEAICNHY